MLLIDSASALSKYTQSQSLALIPTMGALHEGHISLIRKARQSVKSIMVSIFVNPLQFSFGEDYESYPRSLEKDAVLCEENGVDYLFAPKVSEIYSQQSSITQVLPHPQLANCLCGLSRPNLFTGVLTIVLKLFNLTGASEAYFGEKDYQQLLLIRQMVQDLHIPINIKGIPIARDQAGLALSSRNQYLTPEEYPQALKLYQTLQKAKEEIMTSSKPPSEILTELSQDNFEYFEARDPETLLLSEKAPLRLFVAAQIGKTRLIDNLEVNARE